MSDQSQRKVCFVIGPIGAAGSDTRDNADWFLAHVKSVAEPFGYSVIRADKITAPGLISDQIINELMEASLVVADLTEHNANAFYELAIRHTAGLPVIHMIHVDHPIPFDNADFRAIKYSWKNPETKEAALSELRQHIEAIESGVHVSNPFTRARGVNNISQTEDKRDDILVGLLNGQDQLNRRLADLEATVAKTRAQKLAEALLSDQPAFGGVFGSNPDSRILDQNVGRGLYPDLVYSNPPFGFKKP